MLFTAVCTLSSECLHAISVYFGWLSSFMTSFVMSIAYTSLDSSSRLPAVETLVGAIYQA